MKPVIAFLLALAWLLAPAASADSHEPLWLVTDKEAALPDTPMRGPRRRLSEGPEIRVSSPAHKRTYREGFPVDIAFAAGKNGLPVDMDSLRVTYRRAWGIDITDRLRSHVAGDRLVVPEARFPAGQHSVEIYIEDVESNASSRILTVQIENAPKEARR